MIFKMHKLPLALCAVIAVLAVAKGHVSKISELLHRHEPEEVITHNPLVHSTVRVRDDDYKKLNQIHFSKIVQDYDLKIKHFKELYLERIEGINIQLDMVTASIVQIEDYLNPLEVLSDLSKLCVSKYRYLIPIVVDIKKDITRCATLASSQVTKLLSNAITTRNTLQTYIFDNYKKKLEECGSNSKTVEHYSSCLISATSSTSTYTINNRKTFESYMDAAECTAKAYIKRALDCSYSVQTRTITSIAESSLLLNKCLDNGDKCKPCDESNTCPNVMEISENNIKHKLIDNPLVGLPNNPSCLMLSVIKH